MRIRAAELGASLLMRQSQACRTWGPKLRERIGFKQAAVAVARRLAVTMHAMLKTGELFDLNAGAAT